MFAKLVLCFSAGAVASLSLPPAGFILCFFALLYPMSASIAAATPRQAALIMSAAGTGWFAFSLYWISNSLLVGDSPYLFLLPFSFFGLPLFLSFFWAGAGWLARAIGCSHTQRLLLLLFFFCVLEWSRGYVLTGFPWSHPGQLALKHEILAQSAAFVGMYGVGTALIMSLGGVMLLEHGKRILGLALLIPLVILAGLGGYRYSAMPVLEMQQAGDKPAQTVRLVQPNVPQNDRWKSDRLDRHLSRLIALSTQQKPVPHLVIWPESAIEAFYPQDASLLRQLAKVSSAFDGYLLSGMITLDTAGQLKNSAYFLDHDASQIEVSHKQHLVPFGEYVPARWIPFIDVIAGPVDFTSGRAQLFTHPDLGDIAVLICYEAIFPAFLRRQQGESAYNRPDMLVNLTNDAWFGRSAGPHQHLAQARMRAIEEGLPLLRVANTGISAGFDGYGRQLGRIELGHAGMVDIVVPPALPAPIFVRYGAIGLCIMLGYLLILVIFVDPHFQKRQKMTH